jgi:protein SCO1
LAASETARRVPRALLWSVALLALATIAWFAWQQHRAPQEPQAHFVEVSKNAYILPKPDPLGTFSLLDHNGSTFDNSALRGKWTFMFFGYTNCPDICPVTLQVFNQVHKLLGQHPEALRDVRFAFVSVDPQRDTPQLLKEYVPSFNPAFVGVTGTTENIAHLGDVMGVVFSNAPSTDAQHYNVDHSSAVLLTNPDGEFIGVFPAPQTPQEILDGFLAIRKQRG